MNTVDRLGLRYGVPPSMRTAIPLAPRDAEWYWRWWSQVLWGLAQVYGPEHLAEGVRAREGG